MKARIKFTKCGSMRFIGHLDVMRYFQKAFRRAGIPISYSQGFSPHQLMSFASPLGIGLSSDAEYLDIVLDECDSGEEMCRRINAQMNEEIRVREFRVLQEDARPAMAMLAACDYVIALKKGLPEDGLCKQLRNLDLSAPDSAVSYQAKEGCSKLLKDFVAQDKIEVLKKTKRSEKLVDIRENIYALSADWNKFRMEVQNSMADPVEDITESCLDAELYHPLLYMQLTAGSIINIKPELVLQALAAFAGAVYDPAVYQIHRLEMYGDADGKKGEVHTRRSEIPCRLVPLSEFEVQK